jgi:hypothetical protein
MEPMRVPRSSWCKCSRLTQNSAGTSPVGLSYWHTPKSVVGEALARRQRRAVVVSGAVGLGGCRERALVAVSGDVEVQRIALLLEVRAAVVISLAADLS